MVELLTIASLSQNIFKVPSLGMPIIQSLHCNTLIIPQLSLASIHSEPNVDLLTIFHCFEYCIIGRQHTNDNTPVCDHFVTWFPVWSESTKQFNYIYLPRDSWTIVEIGSLTSGQISF
jgi:hypothetical protein